MRPHGLPARQLACALLTMSDTRRLEDDRSGQVIAKALERDGHRVALRRIVRETPDEVEEALQQAVARDDLHVVITTGGTGVAPRDLTVDVAHRLASYELPGFGELFRFLSYQEIGPAAYLSRAAAFVVGRHILYCLPGSTAAVRLAMDRLILPELVHVVGLLRPRPAADGLSTPAER